MSERSQRARETRSRLLLGVLNDAIDSLDAAIPDGLLAIVDDESELLRNVVTKIAARATEALDEEDIVCALYQERHLLEWPSAGGSTLIAHIRTVVKKAVQGALADHLAARIGNYRGDDAA
jgi:hypothetical protein